MQEPAVDTVNDIKTKRIRIRQLDGSPKSQRRRSNNNNHNNNLAQVNQVNRQPGSHELKHSFR